MQRRFRTCIELPPRQLCGADSRSSTDAPASRAISAAHSAAFPPPMTRTSGVCCIRHLLSFDDPPSMARSCAGLNLAKRPFPLETATAAQLRRKVWSDDLPTLLGDARTPERVAPPPRQSKKPGKRLTRIWRVLMQQDTVMIVR